MKQLKVGDVFLRDGVEHVVWFVNDSRASTAPLTGAIQHRVREEDGKIQFLVKQDVEHISPNSELEITRSLGREGLMKAIEALRGEKKPAKSKAKADKPEKTGKKTTEKKAGKKPKAAVKTKPEGATRIGKLGDYKGFSIAAVVRALAAAGWNAKEVRAFLDAEKIKASDQTIKLNIYRGVRNIGGEQAPLAKSDFPTKPKIADAPAKARTAKAPAKKSGKKDKTPASTDQKIAKLKEKAAAKPSGVKKKK